MRAFVEHLAPEVRPTTVAMAVDNLYAAARLIAPRDRLALAGVAQSTACRPRAEPEDRFDRLVPPGTRSISVSS